MIRTELQKHLRMMADMLEDGHDPKHLLGSFEYVRRKFEPLRTAFQALEEASRAFEMRFEE